MRSEIFGLGILLVIGCFLGTLSLPANSTLSTRIAGGQSANILNFPYIASVQINGKHFCGGSIINPRTVLTAAHCLKNELPTALSVHVGSETTALRKGKLFAVSAIHQHPSYSSPGIDYDIGLLRLSSSVRYSKTIQPISLPASEENLIDGIYGVISGWGLKSPNDSGPSELLSSAIVPVINQEVCSRLNADVARLTERMFCAGFLQGGIDSCKMDGGGPFVLQKKLIGIISWGDKCAKPNKPGVYVRVSAFVPWIKYTLWKNYGELI